ncbi:hypothetical protein HanRHA438_Chr08g0345871 [Helianthus annuus]|nr:hypothetical protein HanRHA438_Chr08g0345871 [Helianthus annuus]
MDIMCTAVKEHSLLHHLNIIDHHHIHQLIPADTINDIPLLCLTTTINATVSSAHLRPPLFLLQHHRRRSSSPWSCIVYSRHRRILTFILFSDGHFHRTIITTFLHVTGHHLRLVSSVAYSSSLSL